MKQIARTLGLLVAFCSSAAWTVEIDDISVVKKGKVFSTEAVFLIEARQDVVVDAITAFDRLSELNPAVISSRYEILATGDTRVTTRIRDCVSFFCRSVALVEDLRFDASGAIRSQVVPELSDFASGDALWQFDSLGSQTRVHYQSRIRPKFWLPPLLGPAAFRHALRRQIRVAANNIETLAATERVVDSSQATRSRRISHQ